MKPYYQHQGITIYHGDCREVLMQIRYDNIDIPYDSIVTYPPYGIDYQSSRTDIKKPKIQNDENREMLLFAIDLPFYHSKYVFGRWDQLIEIEKPKSVITWVKNIHSMGDLEHEHARQTELAFFYQGLTHSFPNGRPSDVIYSNRTNNELHPTEKPIDLLTKIVSWTSGVVLDPFMGSGTTLRAAKDLNRQAIGIEIEEKYCEIAAKRLSQEVFQFEKKVGEHD